MSRKSPHCTYRAPDADAESPGWPEAIIAGISSFLREAREEHCLSQNGVAKKLGVHHSWISRLEAGKSVLRSREDFITVAGAIGIECKHAEKTWDDLLREQGGELPWDEVVVLAESLRRQGEARAQVREATENLMSAEVAPGIEIGVLIDLVQSDPVARAAIAGMCSAHQARSERQAK